MPEPKTTINFSKLKFHKDIMSRPGDYIVSHASKASVTRYKWAESEVTVRQENAPDVTLPADALAAYLNFRMRARPDYIAAALQASRKDDHKDRFKINANIIAKHVKTYLKAMLG